MADKKDTKQKKEKKFVNNALAWGLIGAEVVIVVVVALLVFLL